MPNLVAWHLRLEKTVARVVHWFWAAKRPMGCDPRTRDGLQRVLEPDAASRFRTVAHPGGGDPPAAGRQLRNLAMLRLVLQSPVDALPRPAQGAQVQDAAADLPAPFAAWVRRRSRPARVGLFR
jgi:hypothetical protein